jgi:hypothetical protein
MRDPNECPNIRTMLRRLTRLKRFKEGRAPEILIVREQDLIEVLQKKMTADETLFVAEQFNRYYRLGGRIWEVSAGVAEARIETGSRPPTQKGRGSRFPKDRSQ